MLKGNSAKVILADECELASIDSNFACFTDEELREFWKQSRKMERELTQAHSAGLFLTAADLRE